MIALDERKETIHSYELYSPVTAQDDLERGFRRSAGGASHAQNRPGLRRALPGASRGRGTA